MTTWAPGSAPNPPPTLNFYDQASGTLVDPTSVQLDLTYGDTLGNGAPDFAGPYTYAGASSPTPGQVYRISTGVYAYQWTIPNTAPNGVYIANWTVVYEGNTYIGFDNLTVAGGTVTPVASLDVGFWTGSITYGSVVLPLGAVDANGTSWALIGVDGLDGDPTDGQVVQRAGDHGGYPTPQYYAPRPITLRIWASAQSHALRDIARALLQQAVPVSDMATLVYNEPVPKALMVRRSGAIKESYPTLLDCVFSVGLIAPDPRKYGTQWTVSVTANATNLGIVFPVVFPITFPAQTPPGVADVANGGNFETRPVITVNGPITAPGVYNATTGQTISFSMLAMQSTDTLIVDLLNKVALLNGAYYPADLQSSWWVLDPGASQIILQGSGAAGAEMTITYQDAWM